MIFHLFPLIIYPIFLLPYQQTYNISVKVTSTNWKMFVSVDANDGTIDANEWIIVGGLVLSYSMLFCCRYWWLTYRWLANTKACNSLFHPIIFYHAIIFVKQTINMIRYFYTTRYFSIFCNFISVFITIIWYNFYCNISSLHWL